MMNGSHVLKFRQVDGDDVRAILAGKKKMWTRK
jgi:hypothetical protein